MLGITRPGFPIIFELFLTSLKTALPLQIKALFPIIIFFEAIVDPTPIKTLSLIFTFDPIVVPPPIIQFLEIETLCKIFTADPIKLNLPILQWFKIIE